jgi:galacturonosyltransferase
MKKVVFVVNHEIVIYNFRKELVQYYLDLGLKVYVVSPPGKKLENIIKQGVIHIPIKIDRKGVFFFSEIYLLLSLFFVLKKVKPDFVLSFTIKPNIYSGIISRFLKFNHIPNITGLGQVFIKNNWFSKFILFLYKISFKKSKYIFIQNQSNFDFLRTNFIFPSKLVLLPGSGVNLKEFKYVEYPKSQNIRLIYIGRIMKTKGADLFIYVAKELKRTYPNLEFHVCGFMEDNLKKLVKNAVNENIIQYHGQLESTFGILSTSHCMVLPSSYPEGVSNVLLEALSVGRPIITTKNPGCFELLNNQENGILIEEPTIESLKNSIIKFIEQPIEKKIGMGLNGRKFVEQKYDRNLVLKIYAKHTIH